MFQDGGTSNLRLSLMNAHEMTLPPNSWIKLNRTTQTLYGMPLDIHIGHHEFLLAAIDSGGKLARIPFEVSDALQEIQYSCFIMQTTVCVEICVYMRSSL